MHVGAQHDFTAKDHLSSASSGGTSQFALVPGCSNENNIKKNWYSVFLVSIAIFHMDPIWTWVKIVKIQNYRIDLNCLEVVQMLDPSETS